MFDWSTVAASAAAGVGGGAVAAFATLRASRREREQALNQAHEDRRLALQQAEVERAAQRSLLDESIRQAEVVRERERLDLLDAVVAELRFNLDDAGQRRAMNTFVLFQMDLMGEALRELATLPEHTRASAEAARWAMLRHNSLALAYNTRALGGSIPNKIDELAERAAPIIQVAMERLTFYVNESRAGRPPLDAPIR